MPLVIIGSALIVPASWVKIPAPEMDEAQGFSSPEERLKVETAAMKAVMMVENELNNAVRDRSRERIGYDLESTCSRTGTLRFIEVKGRKKEATTVTITKNEIIRGVNVLDQYFLAPFS